MIPIINSHIFISNCGIVFKGSKTKALKAFKAFKEISEIRKGKIGGERVVLFCNNKLTKAYTPKKY